MSEPWTPHDYQIRSVKHLLERGGAALFLDPGMGKTSSVLAALKVLKTRKANGEDIGTTLVLAPLRVAQNVWPSEVAKWTDFNDLSVVVLHGPDKDRLLREPADIYVLNYEGLDWFLTAHGIERTGATRLIVDESTRLKNSQSKRFKALRKHLNAFEKRWILTGTPSANGLEDLWAQIFLLDGGAALGRYITHFRMQYFIPPMPGGFRWELRPGAAEEIYEKIKPLCLRLAAEDYLELPELVNVNVMVDMPPAARNTYEDIYNHFITDLASGVVTAANAAVAGNKCLQVCNGALYSPAPEYTILHDAKLDALMDLLDELNGSPALVFYQYDHDLERIQKRLGGTGAWLGAATTAAKLQALVTGFNAGCVPVLLGHPASAGHGLNLQGTSNHVIWFGLPWSLELYDQALKRVWRQGNPNTHVFIHHILANDSMDVRVLRVLHGKDRSQRALFAALTS